MVEDSQTWASVFDGNVRRLVIRRPSTVEQRTCQRPDGNLRIVPVGVLPTAQRPKGTESAGIQVVAGSIAQPGFVPLVHKLTPLLTSPRRNTSGVMDG